MNKLRVCNNIFVEADLLEDPEKDNKHHLVFIITEEIDKAVMNRIVVDRKTYFALSEYIFATLEAIDAAKKRGELP